MKPSKKKAKKKKKPEAPGTPVPPAAAAAHSTPDAPCSPSETLTLPSAAAAAAAASETDSSGGSSCEAASTSAFTGSSSGRVSTFSSSASTASSSATGDERRDLAWLLDAFASATIDQVDAAYREAGGDPFLAAGILGATLDAHPRPQPPPPPDPSPRDGSGWKKSSRRPKKVVCAASGMVSDVIGKEYTRPAPSPPTSGTNAWKGKGVLSASNEWKGGGEKEDVGRKESVEEAEQFLCGMLGDNSELGMGVVRDVLGQTGYDVEKALDVLLDISGVSSSRDSEMHNTNGSNGERNGTLCPTIFLRNGLSMGNIAADDNRSLFQLADQISSMALQSEVEHDFLWGEPQTSYAQAVMAAPRSATLPSRPTESKANSQQVLESLFKIPEIRTYEPSSMDWKKVVKKLQSFNSPIESNNQERPKNGDGYREFRGISAQHYDRMKQYYQQAAVAYSKGDKSYASYLAEEAKHYRELARLEDEKASRKIFEARNKHITNTVTIDLHGQHVKQAMKLLKVHMMICVCMPSVLLRVITGCGSEGTGKGKIKRSVIELVEKEHIEWHEENHGTIVLRLGGPREYGFSEHDSDTD